MASTFGWAQAGWLLLIVAIDVAAAIEPSEQASFGYGDRGLEFQDGETDLWAGLRFQSRFDTFKGTLNSVDDLLADQDPDLILKRGRIKGGGKFWRDWLDVYSEYDFTRKTWLDYRATVTVGGWLDIRAGQWKSDFNRERIDSSGKQQLIERSIATYWFTIDRQRGLGTSARIAAGSPADTTIWIQTLSGKGLGGSFGDGDALYLFRAQWNPAGEVLPFSQADLARRKSPLSSVAIAYVTGDSPYTSFSSDGGGSLPGFEEGDYQLDQWLFETALHYRGLGWQQELHFKRIRDKTSGAVTRLAGGYAQIGSFPNEWWPVVPAALELVGRAAVVDPDRGLGSNLQQEWTIGANWYFNGHRNKLTLDFAWVDIEDPDSSASKRRLRLQWELSL